MSVLYPLIQALVLFAVAPLLSGITRVARARLHNSRGPGVLQEYRDIIKLLGRQSVGPYASGWVFRLTPYVMVGVMLTIATALPVVTVGSPLPQLGDLITLLYLFAIARFFFAISGLDTGSPFTAIGASREAMLGVLVEPMLLLGLWVAAQVAGSTNNSKITDSFYQGPLSESIPRVVALCACAFATFIEMGKLPFDLAEAEQELQEGPLSEYSGSGFGVMKWGISLKQLVVLQMFVGVFIPWGQMETFTAGGLLLALVIAIVKLVVGVLVIALFENSMARLRLDITPRITWAGFGFAFLLQEGPLSEYSGSGFGVMKWGISLKQLVVLQMFVGVFIPWGQMETFTAGGLLLALVIAIVKLVVGVLVIALFENSMARLRLDITPRITWAGFGFAFLAFVSLLAA